MKEHIIVSMTSFPGRITNVGKSIFFMLSKQTMPPDEIYLWLAAPEFPNKELDLPKDLQTILKHENVHLHWLSKNTFVHKRHEIFKLTNDNDLVFFIDDDVRYADNLIETVVKTHTKWPNAIICYNQYSAHKYSGRRILYGRALPEMKPMPNYNRWCGQSMIPSKLYPKEILDDEHQAVRDKTSPISDECWFQPWTVFYEIPIFHLHYGWGDDIDATKGKKTGLVATSHKKDSNGYEKRDNWLNAVLDAYPNILDKYKNMFFLR